MPVRRNYILGKGELLARNEKVATGFGEGKDPYSFSEQKQFLAPIIRDASKAIDALPAAACPNDEAVAVLTLHPKYLSKSSFPNALLLSAGLRLVGSKAVTIVPRRDHLQRDPTEMVTSEMYVAGSRANFRRWSQSVAHMASTSSEAGDLLKVEAFRAPSSEERVKPIPSNGKSPIVFEVVLHAGKSNASDTVLRGFRSFLNTLGVDVDLDERLDSEDLSFVPVRTSPGKIKNVAEFSFLRTVREMPQIREFWPDESPFRSVSQSFPISLPNADAVDKTIRVAIFDGGCPDIPSLSRWVKRVDVENLTAPVPSGLRHGLSVTSALLFGPLKPGGEVPRPFAAVDHYRVVDTASSAAPRDSMYAILRRIIKVLESERYDFVNFSIGPEGAIDDGDINPWTALIDPLLASGRTLATIAVGNGGESDAALGLNRIQPPSDCVNALSVGACDQYEANWKRASYSSVGHGRCPGIMKPDGLAFGGEFPDSPFNVIDHTTPTRSRGTRGTSFASPLVLRTAIGVRAALGPVVSGLALKALLVHGCQSNDQHLRSEVGWGRFSTDIEELISCGPGMAHILYQGHLDPKKFLRADIPMPKERIAHDVIIRATLCIATPTDPQHPATYTRNGLQIFFSRDKNDKPIGKTNPRRTGFFKSGVGIPERSIRADALQWETVRHAEKCMRGALLVAPCFDIHLNPREEGHDVDGEEVPYAMVVTVSCAKVSDLFDRIFDRYRFTLQELKPRFELPIQV